MEVESKAGAESLSSYLKRHWENVRENPSAERYVSKVVEDQPRLENKNDSPSLSDTFKSVSVKSVHNNEVKTDALNSVNDTLLSSSIPELVDDTSTDVAHRPSEVALKSSDIKGTNSDRYTTLELTFGGRSLKVRGLIVDKICSKISMSKPPFATGKDGLSLTMEFGEHDSTDFEISALIGLDVIAKLVSSHANGDVPMKKSR